MFFLSRITDKARYALRLARQSASKHHQQVAQEHVLLGILNQCCVGYYVFKQLGVDPDTLGRRIECLIAAGSTAAPAPKPMPRFAVDERLEELAAEEAARLGQDYIGTEHLVLAMVREPTGEAGQVLSNLGMHLEQFRQAAIDVLP